MGARVAVLNEGVLALVMLEHLVQKAVEMGFRDRAVDVAPPDFILGGVFFDDEAVIGGTARVLARFRDDGAPGGQFAFAAADGLLEQMVGVEVPIGLFDPAQSVIFQAEF